jgi:hypothetical protein
VSLVVLGLQQLLLLLLYTRRLTSQRHLAAVA